MMQEVSIIVRSFCAEKIELTGHLAGIEGEVLAYQIGEAGDDVLLAEDGLLDGF